MRFLTAAGLVAALSFASLGCQNAMQDENKALHAQNRELQSKVDQQSDEISRLEDERERMARERQEAMAAQRDTRPEPPPTDPGEEEDRTAATNGAGRGGTRAPQTDPQEDFGDLVTESNPAEGTVTVTLEGDVFFDPGQDTIKQPVRSKLDQVAAALKTAKYAGRPVRVEGHTDKDPIKRSKWKSNEELSEARARAVKNYLVKKGIDESLITTVGHGAAKSKGGQKSADRRVEIVVVVD